MSEETKEQILYNKFVDTLLDKLDSEEVSPKELEVVMKFLDNNNIQASMKNKGLSELTKAAMELPFDNDDEAPLRRIK